MHGRWLDLRLFCLALARAGPRKIPTKRNVLRGCDGTCEFFYFPCKKRGSCCDLLPVGVSAKNTGDCASRFSTVTATRMWTWPTSPCFRFALGNSPGSVCFEFKDRARLKDGLIYRFPPRSILFYWYSQVTILDVIVVNPSPTLAKDARDGAPFHPCAGEDTGYFNSRQ